MALEVVVNGYPVARQEFLADGALRDVSFEVPLSKSSWVALRVLPSSHTNPVFVLVEGKPIRASRRSAEWCLQSVEKCWKSKVAKTRKSERSAARRTYDVARDAYRKILAECREE